MAIRENESGAKENAAEDQFHLRAPQISLPKGGGAVRGMGEKFAANPVTGTGSMSVPLAVSPGRGGFGPQLSLSYDSGAGNGVFGLGWSVSLPSITRKTDKGLPKYRDAEESDVFILAGAEDLVPVFVQVDGQRVLDAQGNPRVREDTIDLNGQRYRVRRYRPRTEGAFALIERWTNRDDDADVFWRTISRDNLTTWYGKSANSRIVDPVNASHIFSWSICESDDDKGNVVLYDYLAENDVNVAADQTSERNRSRTGNRYPHRIRYGNTPSRFAANFNTAVKWHFEVRFDYGQESYREHAPEANGNVSVSLRTSTPSDGAWPARLDAFSNYRAGFEVRTHRLCRRVLMFHRFDELLGNELQLVRSTELVYRESPTATQLVRVAQCGFLPIAQTTTERRYLKRQLPPLEFDYTKAVIDTVVRDVDSASLENVPQGFAGSSYQWVDLYGEGLSGCLTEQGDGWFYKSNLGPINLERDAQSPVRAQAKLAPLERVAAKPNASLAAGGAQLMDLAGDGQPDLVLFDGPTPGFYESDGAGSWTLFRAFLHQLNRDTRDPNLRFVDLDGDGRADALITEGDVFTWHASLGEAGFSAAERVASARDEEQGPVLVFADGTQSIYLADISGDGLTDLVRLRNGEICYWPNLGYGRFGAKVTMGNAPWFDAPDAFDQRRVRFADIDGTGLTDIIYLHAGGARVYFNQSGNSWSSAQTLPAFPHIDQLSAVTVADLLGNGTACLVWSSPLPGDTRQPMKYVDLMGGQKPYLLTQIRNNLGATTTIEYAPSTRFYLQDKLAGRPWATRLPFPVHCVARVSVHDCWRDARFTSTYSYHHGYFDGKEREFRGFGRVEQVDTEEFGVFAAGNAASPWIADDLTLYQPPVKTISWFHTGADIDREKILTQFAREYFPRSIAARPADVQVDAVFQEKPLDAPDLRSLGLSNDEWREAMRACKGLLLRQEVYELDVDALHSVNAAQVDFGTRQHKAVKLLSAATHNCNIRLLQPKAQNRHAVFLVSESEALSYHYELALNSSTPLQPDPRIAHTLNLSTDELGNVLQSVAIGYRRVRPFSDASLSSAQIELIREVQSEQHLAYVETHFTDDVIQQSSSFGVQCYRLRVPCEVQTFELSGIAPSSGRYFTLADLRHYRFSPRYAAAAPIKAIARNAYHQLPQITAPTMRLVERGRTLFFDDDNTSAGFLTAPLPLGQLGTIGLIYEQYKLALTESLLDAVFTDGQLDELAHDGRAVRAALRDPSTSGYVSGAQFFRLPPPEAASEYWMRSGVAGFASDAALHFYLPENYTDAFGNTTTLQYDGNHDLYVRSSTDARGNRTSVERFDYRVLAPAEYKDANNNVTAVAFDALGLPVASAAMGKQRTESGDNLTNVALDLPPRDIAQFFNAPYNVATSRQWLANTTMRYVYDLGENVATDGATTYGHRPAAACGIARETHVAAGAAARLQVAVEYSDGLGNVLVKKAQAEPDPDSTAPNPPLRWIASGKVVLNNKGKPVKQFEPYFSNTEHRFDPAEAQTAVGGASVVYYDAPGRVVRTEAPDGSYSRVTFSPWHVASFDANDTVGEANNGWYERNSAANASNEAKRAAALTRVHENTPSVAVLDSLGRNVVAIEHNRLEDAQGTHQANGKRYRNERYATFSRLDAEGKPLWLRDARGNLVMQYVWPTKPDRDELRTPRDVNVTANPNNDIGQRVPTYDIAGNVLFQRSMDAGNRWMINDALGKPLFAWDRNERQEADDSFVGEQRLYSSEYDALHRPTAMWLRTNDGDAINVERLIYTDTQQGSGAANPQLAADQAANLIGQLVRHYDASGLTQTVRRDFKGNILEMRRRLNNRPTESVIDWQGNAPDAALETDVFRQLTEYDALNRMTLQYNWHRDRVGKPIAKYVPSYNQRGLLASEKLTTRLMRSANGIAVGPNTVETDAIRQIRYNAKGQKTALVLGNNTTTQYDYDDKTFRLKQLRTTRLTAGQNSPAFPQTSSNLSDARIVQQLRYTYDPVGNITEIVDEAYEPVFFQNQAVEPRNTYEYDALYRLISASGRENGALQGAPELPGAAAVNAQFPIQSGNANALRNYRQTFEYDSVGNLQRMRHAAGLGSWTRRFRYADDSNRLLASWDTNDDWVAVNPAVVTRYGFDTHGNMRNLRQNAPRYNLRWDHRDMIRAVDLGGGGKAYYQYDANKQRTRKRIDNQNGRGGYWERIYLDGYELYRRYGGNGSSVVEEIESIHVFEGAQRVLLIDDVIKASDAAYPRPDDLLVKSQTLFRYQYSNHLGSSAIELDHEAKIISYEEYHPYGTSAYSAAQSGSEAPRKRYRYTGMERDEESGLAYHGARYFAPWIARWIASDPAGLADGVNLFSYARNKPTRRIDSNGRQSMSEEEAKRGRNQIIEYGKFKEKIESALPKERTPTTAKEKSVDVDIETQEHDRAVIFVVNEAIKAAAESAKASGDELTEYELLRNALFDFIDQYRNQSGERSQNLTLRDADHYLTGRIQKWRSFLPGSAHDSDPGPTKDDTTVALGNLAAAEYDYQKRRGFSSARDPSAPNAKSGLEENSKPAAAPGGRFWAWLGGQHLLERGDPTQKADANSLQISEQDVSSRRLEGALMVSAFSIAHSVARDEIRSIQEAPGQLLNEVESRVDALLNSIRELPHRLARMVVSSLASTLKEQLRDTISRLPRPPYYH